MTTVFKINMNAIPQNQVCHISSLFRYHADYSALHLKFKVVLVHFEEVQGYSTYYMLFFAICKLWK